MNVPVVLNDVKNSRPVLVYIEADYDNGAFLSLLIKDRRSGETILDIAIDNDADVTNLYDAVYGGMSKYLTLRG